MNLVTKQNYKVVLLKRTASSISKTFLSSFTLRNCNTICSVIWFNISFMKTWVSVSSRKNWGITWTLTKNCREEMP